MSVLDLKKCAKHTLFNIVFYILVKFNTDVRCKQNFLSIDKSFIVVPHG